MIDRTTLELMALTALSALAGGTAVAMEYVAVGSVFAAITLWAVVIGVIVSPAD